MVVWLMGMAGSGKTTLGKALYAELKNMGISNLVYLDGDEFREVLGEFGYDRDSRVQVAIKRAKLCQMLSAQGLIVIASSISLFKENYDFNRQHIEKYFEVYVRCDMDELKRRNQKGLYSGEIKNVVGLDISIDEPKPDLALNNGQDGIRDVARALIERVIEGIQTFKG